MIIIDMKSDISGTKIENIEWECGANGAEMFENCFERKNFSLSGQQSSCLCVRLVDYYMNDRARVTHTFLFN